MIRPGRTSDHRFVGEVAIEVFSHLGDYGRIIPEWLSHEGVLLFILEEEGAPLGFTMLGFYRLPGAQVTYAADLLAIALKPAAQGRGLGRRLLQHAITTARAARSRLPVRELRLSVAEPNARARRLFAGAGFFEETGNHGTYDGGQKVLHMRLVF